MTEHVPSWWPMAGYALGFVMGATSDIRFAFYSKCLRRRPYSSAAIAFRATAEDAAKVRSKIVNPLVWEDPLESFDDPPSLAQPRTGKAHRQFINNPVQIAECGGPCTESPEHCDCGALWVPTKPQPSGGRLITEGEWRAEWASIDDDGSFSLGLVRDHNPNPPPTDP